MNFTTNMFLYILNNNLRYHLYKLVHNEKVRKERQIICGGWDLDEEICQLVSIYSYDRINDLVCQLIDMEEAEKEEAEKEEADDQS